MVLMMFEWQQPPSCTALGVHAHGPCALRSIEQCDLHGLFVAVSGSLVVAEYIVLCAVIPFDTDLVFF